MFVNITSRYKFYVEPNKRLIMKRSDKIKARKRIENGCNFPSLMTIKVLLVIIVDNM